MQAVAEFRALVDGAESDGVICRNVARTVTADLDSTESELLRAIPRKSK